MDRLALGLVAVALLAGQLACVAPGEVLLAMGTLLVVVGAGRRDGQGRRRGRARLALVAAGIVALGYLRAEGRVRRHELARASVLENGPRTFDGTVEVTSSPVVTHGTLRFHARPDVGPGEGGAGAQLGGAPLPELVDDVVLYDGPPDLARGDRLAVTAHLSLPERFWNDSDPRPAAAHAGTLLSGGTEAVRRLSRGHGIGAFIDRARAAVRRRIDATFRPDEAPLARALVLGEEDLAPEDAAAFRTSGLSHLLAVSGTHLVLVVAGTLALLRALLVRIEPLAARVDVGRLVALAGPPLAFVYASFAGGSGSALRAAWMSAFVALARVFGRRAEAFRALVLSSLAMAWLDPLVAFDVSFALSVAATLGLLVIAPALGRWSLRRLAQVPPPLRSLATRPAMGAVVRTIAATVAASLACAPILAGFAPTLPLGGALANLLAVPLGELAALPLCLAHACLFPWPDAERGAAEAGGASLGWLRLLATWFSRRANAEVLAPTSLEVAVVIAFAAIAALGVASWRSRAMLALGGIGALAACEALARSRAAPHGELRVTYLDIGQGDSALVDLPDGEALLIDGGGLVGSPIDVGARVLLPLLRARRRTRLAAVILTHPHPDHFLGLVPLLASSVQVGELWDSGQGEREAMGGGYAQLLAEARAAGVPVRRPAELCSGRARELGGVDLRVLAPCPDVDGDLDPNDNSVVVRLSYGQRSFLFVVDAERAEERRLLARAASSPADALAADVLKVGHHGSRTSTSPDFLAAVSPSLAVASCGVRNRFGHPHPETLATFAASPTRLLRTDRSGAVQITTNGSDLRLDTAAASP